MDRFVRIPHEVYYDTELNLNQMRVLVLLYSYRNNKTGQCFPKRETIARKLGFNSVNQVSNITRELEQLGWITKEGNGGRSRATRYDLHPPERIWEVDFNAEDEDYGNSEENGNSDVTVCEKGNSDVTVTGELPFSPETVTQELPAYNRLEEQNRLEKSEPRKGKDIPTVEDPFSNLFTEPLPSRVRGASVASDEVPGRGSGSVIDRKEYAETLKAKQDLDPFALTDEEFQFLQDYAESNVVELNTARKQS